MMTIARPARAAVMSWERIGRLASSVAAANAREKAPFRSDDRLMSGIASSPCLGERNRTALISPLFSSLFLSIEPKLSHRKLRGPGSGELRWVVVSSAEVLNSGPPQTGRASFRDRGGHSV